MIKLFLSRLNGWLFGLGYIAGVIVLILQTIEIIITKNATAISIPSYIIVIIFQWNAALYSKHKLKSKLMMWGCIAQGLAALIISLVACYYK
ncbi:MAG: hypothetical protein ACD_80C00048G0010 [uncultured bacterium (gcode 4)]|uniref:Uncharacterized protein n=1 Tax=uncultured bacterium (gcode 4) TaxID=1234023 RepID=K1X5I2_9BACT|nr:MAG: hypothetical protein ACD_80C00048G0010 [uncultured bacterium (gcode 4)]HBB04289.1 hypothetical protein [Candidatus Gracilibacteria bacterium]